MPDSMGVVAGADEVEQTPQAAARGPQAAARTAQAPGQMPGVSQGGTSTAEQAQGATSTSEQAQGATSTSEQAQGATSTSEQAQGVASTAESLATTNHAAQNSEQQTPEAESPVEQAPPTPGFGERGRMRRRARFLRKARELAYRDLGGLVFDLHRFGQRNDPLVLAKLATLREIDTELRGLEDGLRDHRPVTVLREVGIAACPRCAAIHGSDDRFCPGCGLAFDANADRPLSTAPVAPQVRSAPAVAQAPIATPPSTTVLASTSAPAPLSAPAPASAEIPAPQLKPTAPPVAAKPTATPEVAVKTSPSPAEAKPAEPPPASAPKTPERAQEDEPTQILRPPRGDASS